MTRAGIRALRRAVAVGRAVPLRRTVAAALVAGALLAAACADDFIADPESGLRARVEAVEWPDDPILLGDTITLRVRVVDQATGAEVEPGSIDWEVLPGFATDVVNSAGDSIVLHVVGLVELRVRAALDHPAFDTASVSDTLPVHLAGMSIAAARGDALAALGDTVTVEAHGLDVHGAPVDVAGWSWQVSGAAVTIPAGNADAVRATAAANGRAWIVATHPICSGHCTDSVALDVVQAVTQLDVSPQSAQLTWIGDTAHLRATPRDANGNPAPGSVTWTTSAAGTASVGTDGSDSAFGIVSAVGNGAASIVAQLGALVDTVDVTVAQAVAQLELTAPDTIGVGDTLQLSAVARDSGGTVVAGVTADWSTTDGAIVSLSDDGRVIALARGLATVRASAGGVLASTQVLVAAWALAFDGSDYVEVPAASALAPGDPFTLEAWVRPHTAQTSAALVAIWDGAKSGSSYALCLQGLVPTAMVRGGPGNNTVGTLAAPAVLSTNSWHHVAFVYDNGDGTLYVDGALVASTQDLPHDPQQLLTRPLRLGADAQANPAFFDGELDEVRLWASARTEEQIAASMTQRLAPLDNLDLRAYWPLFEGTGNPLSLVRGLIGVLGGDTGGDAAPTWTTEASPAP